METNLEHRAAYDQLDVLVRLIHADVIAARTVLIEKRDIDVDEAFGIVFDHFPEWSPLNKRSVSKSRSYRNWMFGDDPENMVIEIAKHSKYLTLRECYSTLLQATK